MAKNCGKCVKAIRGIEFAKCGGYCDNIFHFTCCGTSRPAYETISSNSFWLCDDCRAIVNNRCLKELCDNIPVIQSLKLELNEMMQRITALTGVVDASAASTKACLSQFEKQLGDCKSAGIPSLTEKSELTPRVYHNNWPLINHPAPKRRREEQLVSNRDIIVGTNTNLSTTVVTVPMAEKKFWIYLSRIHPDVSAENVNDMAKQCLQCEEPLEVIKLVKKDEDLTSRRFVSFKVGIDPKLKTTALSPCTWPTGVFFREFIEYGTKNGRGVAPMTPMGLTPVRL